MTEMSSKHHMVMMQKVFRLVAEEPFFKCPTIEWFIEPKAVIHGIIFDDKQYLFRYWPKGAKDSKRDIILPSYPDRGIVIDAPELEELEQTASSIGAIPILIVVTKENSGVMSFPFTKGEKMIEDRIKINKEQIKWLT